MHFIREISRYTSICQARFSNIRQNTETLLLLGDNERIVLKFCKQALGLPARQQAMDWWRNDLPLEPKIGMGAYTNRAIYRYIRDVRLFDRNGSPYTRVRNRILTGYFLLFESNLHICDPLWINHPYAAFCQNWDTYIARKLVSCRFRW